MKKLIFESKSGNRRTYKQVVVKEANKHYSNQSSDTIEALETLATFNNGEEFENSIYYPAWFDACDFEDADIVVIVNAVKLNSHIESLLKKKGYYYPSHKREFQTTTLSTDEIISNSQTKTEPQPAIGWRNIELRMMEYTKKYGADRFTTHVEITKTAHVLWKSGDFYSGLMMGRIIGGKFWDGILYDIEFGRNKRRIYIDEGVELFRCSDLGGFSFKKTSLTECDIDDVNIEDCILLDCSLSFCELKNCTYSYTGVLDRSTTLITETSFTHCDINLDGDMSDFEEVIANCELDDYTKNNILENVSEDDLYRGTIYSDSYNETFNDY